MTKAFTLVFCLTLLGCATQSPLEATQRDKMIQVAREELNRRHIKIPKDCIITVVDWVSVSAIQPPRKSHLVRFERPPGDERNMLYAVVIDQGSGKASEFLDYRGLTSGGRNR